MKNSERVALAERLLQEVSKRHGIDIRSMRDPAQHDHFVLARKDFARRAYEAKIGTTTIGKLLHRDASTINHHVADLIQARKEARKCTTIQKNGGSGLPG